MNDLSTGAIVYNESGRDVYLDKIMKLCNWAKAVGYIVLAALVIFLPIFLSMLAQWFAGHGLHLPQYVGIIPLATYWATLALVTVTLLYVKITKQLLSHTAQQAQAMREQVEAGKELLITTKQDLTESHRPILVPITDLPWIKKTFLEFQYDSAKIPIIIQNVGKGSALNIEVAATFLNSAISQPRQPFSYPSLTSKQFALLGHFVHHDANQPYVLTEMSVKITYADVLNKTHQTIYKDNYLSFTII